MESLWSNFFSPFINMVLKDVIQCTGDQLKNVIYFWLSKIALEHRNGRSSASSGVSRCLKSPSTCCETADEKYCTKWSRRRPDMFLSHSYPGSGWRLSLDKTFYVFPNSQKKSFSHHWYSCIQCRERQRKGELIGKEHWTNISNIWTERSSAWYSTRCLEESWSMYICKTPSVHMVQLIHNDI